MATHKSLTFLIISVLLCFIYSLEEASAGQRFMRVKRPNPLVSIETPKPLGITELLDTTEPIVQEEGEEKEEEEEKDATRSVETADIQEVETVDVQEVEQEITQEEPSLNQYAKRDEDVSSIPHSSSDNSNNIPQEFSKSDNKGYTFERTSPKQSTPKVGDSIPTKREFHKPKEFKFGGTVKNGPSDDVNPSSDGIERTKESCGNYGDNTFFDLCGKCNGTNKCVDCNDVIWGKSKPDRCGKCDGANECVGCDGVAYINNPAAKPEYDICGTCGGDGSSCISCDTSQPEPDPTKRKILDACGICGGDGSECCSSGGDCNAHGVCDASLKGCRCDPGYTGPFCQARKDMCQFSNGEDVCNGRGLCNDPDTGICDCQSGWKGDHCQWKTCSGHGWYNPNLKACKCDTGYAGEDCSTCKAPPHDVAFICLEKYINGVQQSKTAVVGMSGSTQYVQAFVGNTDEWVENIPEGVKDASQLSQSVLADMVQPVLDSRLKTIHRFLRVAVDKKDVVIHLTKYSALSKATPGLIILPGTTINGTTYGCDCRIATAVDEFDLMSLPTSDDPQPTEVDYSKMTDMNDEKVPNNGKSTDDLRKEAYGKLWGNTGKINNEKKKNNKDSFNHAGSKGKKSGQTSINSLSMAKDQFKQDYIVRSPFTIEQREEYGAFLTGERIIQEGTTYHTRFIEPRAPLTQGEAHDEINDVINHFGFDGDATVDDAVVIREIMNNLLQGETSHNTVTNVVFSLVLIFSVVGSIVMITAIMAITSALANNNGE